MAKTNITIQKILNTNTISKENFIDREYLNFQFNNLISDNLVEIKSNFPSFPDLDDIFFPNFSNTDFTCDIKYDIIYDGGESYDYIGVFNYKNSPFAIGSLKYETLNSAILDIDIFKKMIEVILKNYSSNNSKSDFIVSNPSDIYDF